MITSRQMDNMMKARRRALKKAKALRMASKMLPTLAECFMSIPGFHRKT
jgi:hypothetical protein